MVYEKKFIHFGCWNQGLCKKKDTENNNPITKVMRQLETTITRVANGNNKYDFIVVAGDNYYPDKPEKTEKKDKTEKTEKKDKTEKKKEKGDKIIKEANLKSGFACLPEGIEINVILGNHDLETSKEKKPLYLENNSTLEEGNCKIMQLEQEAIKENEQTFRVGLDLYKEKWLGDSTLVLMIDSSMYDTEDADSFLPCYNVKTKKNYTDISELHAEQQEFVDKTIDKYSNKLKNVIVIGHHPISGYKYKNEATNLIQSFEGLIKLLYSMKQKLISKKVNYYYLCADLHLYQAGTITINNKIENDTMLIQQYVVGTGGTKLDDSPFLKETSLPSDDEPTFTNDEFTVNYTMTDEQKEIAETTGKKYGFLSCVLKRSNMYFTFIDTEGQEYSEQNTRTGTRRTGRRTGRKSTRKSTRKTIIE